MQEYKTLLTNLKKILKLRIEDEKQTIEKLVSITGKDYKSVWRRLKGEYKFSFDEIFNICSELGISMESLGENNPASVSSLRVYRFPDTLTFEVNKSHIAKLYQILKNAVECTDSSYISICNRLPEVFYTRYNNISQLLLMKLNYFTTEELDPRFYRLLKENWNLFDESNNTFFDLIGSFHDLTVIWSPDIIVNTVRDVLFFLDIGLITQNDADMIKEELKDMLTWIDDLCENPKKSLYKNFTFAVSPIDMNFHSNTVLSSKGNTVFYFLYHLAFCYTENEEDVNSQKVIMDCMMRGASILSGSNHRERKFFMKQQNDELEKI